MIMLKINSGVSLFENLAILVPAGSIYFVAIVFESWRIVEKTLFRKTKKREDEGADDSSVYYYSSHPGPSGIPSCELGAGPDPYPLASGTPSPATSDGP